jgi:hypothetical protein
MCRVVAVAACTAIGLIQAPGGALAAPATPGHPHGFFVTGEGQATMGNGPSALVRDPRGGEHVVTIKHDLSDNGRVGRVVYLTKRPGASRWVSHAVRGLRVSSDRTRVEAHLSVDGKRIFAVLYACTGVFVMETSTAANRLPKPTRLTSLDTCNGRPTPGQDPPVGLAATVIGGYDDVLLPDPDQGNAPAIWSDTGLNKSWAPQRALPTADHFVPTQIGAVPDHNELVVVGYGSDGANQGIYVVEGRGFDQPWTGPTRIATLHSATSNFTIESLTASRRANWVGLSRPVEPGQRHRLFVERGTGDGWQGVFALPHSTVRDSSLRLAYNQSSGHLHAAFTRVTPGSKADKSGIVTEKMAGSRWTRLKFLTHWYRDFADQITFNRNGGAVIGYTQR